MKPEKKPWLLDLKIPPQEEHAPATPATLTSLPEDTFGLALAGEGLRGAAFCLGLLQALARAGWLSAVDFLATVAGGSYTGAFLGRDFVRGASPGSADPHDPEQRHARTQARVAHDLAGTDSRATDWLRRHANYLAPASPGDPLPTAAGFVRNLLSLYLVLGLLLFAGCGLVNGLIYLRLETWCPRWLQSVFGTVAPLTGPNSAGWLNVFVALAEAIFWVGVISAAKAFWYTAESLREEFVGPVVVSGFLLAAALVLLTGSPLALILLAAGLAWVIRAWAVARRTNGNTSDLNRENRIFARNYLTRYLGRLLGVVIALVGFGLLDFGGRSLTGVVIGGGMTTGNLGWWFLVALLVLAANAAVLRLLAGWLIPRNPLDRRPQPGAGNFVPAGLVLLLGILPPLLLVTLASHLAYKLGGAYPQGLALSLVALVVSVLLGLRACVLFVNRSAPLASQTNLLARLFLGATNPARRLHPDGQDITQVVPEDDLAIERYHPEANGGPLHLLTCSVSETLDVASARGARMRPAEPLTVGPAGLSLSRYWHALGHLADLEPLPSGGEPHPLQHPEGRRAQAQALDLREWMAISGAPCNLGVAAFSGAVAAFLAGFLNHRHGYWWDSGLDERERGAVGGKKDLWRYVIGCLATTFHAQILLLSELAGLFPGPWQRYWYLSGGSAFDATGAYELLRRRVPFVLIADGGANHDDRGAGLANLVRLVRIDLGGEVEEVSDAPHRLEDCGVPEAIATRLGAIRRLTQADGAGRVRAVLLRVRYPDPPVDPNGDAWLNRRQTWVLYLRAALLGDEPADILHYAAGHPAFPHEPADEQVFDDPQWESYRRLGEFTGQSLVR